MIPALGTHSQVSGKTLLVQDLPAGAALLEDIARQIAPALGGKPLLLLSKPGQLDRPPPWDQVLSLAIATTIAAASHDINRNDPP